MALYIVLSRTPNEQLSAAIAEQFPAELHQKYNDTSWIISGSGTAQEVSELIGVKKGGFSGVVVFAATNSYYGVNHTTFWDWLKSRIEGESNG